MATRQSIIEAADNLFYQHGYEATSFARIAAAVGISRGNFYHHFKTKDDILDAVVALRLARTRRLLEQWAQEHATPQARLLAFVRILVTNRAKIMKYGCPVGTLCVELAKLDHAAAPAAAQIFALFRDWLAVEFSRLGHEGSAQTLALHLLSRSQGIATLSTAFHDESFIDHEIDLLDAWIASLAP